MTSEFSPQGGQASTSDTAPDNNDLSAKAQFHDLKRSLSEDVSSARDAVVEGKEQATEKLKDAVSDQAHFAAHQVAGVARALQKVGAELEGSDQAHVGRYVGQMGSGVRDFAERMEGKDTAELARMAEDFGRKQPLAFLGMAALAGLMASRFLTASAKHASSDGAAGGNASASSGMGGVSHG